MNDLQKITTFQEDIAVIKDITTKSFLITGKILSNIQTDKKYKTEGYKTFADAIEQELGLKRAHAYRLIEASRTYEILSPQGDILPTEETQIRYLSKLNDAEKVEVWQEVAKDKVPTAKEVQEAVNRKLGKVNSTKKIIKSTTIDTTKYVPIELYTEAQKRIKILEEAVESMLPYVDKAMSFETVPDPAPEKSTLLPRQIVYDFIKQKGNTIQCHALKSDDLSNDKLYSIFVKVREDYKTSTPPPAWDMIIINATGIL